MAFRDQPFHYHSRLLTPADAVDYRIDLEKGDEGEKPEGKEGEGWEGGDAQNKEEMMGDRRGRN